jgi:hypothetical protein
MGGRGNSPAQGKVTRVQGSGPERKVGENAEGHAPEVANSSGDRLRGWRSRVSALNGQVQETGEEFGLEYSSAATWENSQPKISENIS